MIFVTVGTHEQPFNRLIQKMDDLVADGTVKEEVYIQCGYSTYKPKNLRCSKLIPYKEMVRYVTDARIVITHGGPASFIMPLQIGKVPIVVPRKKIFNEHVNDHQVAFAEAVRVRMGIIIPVNDIEKLKETIVNYDKTIASMPSTLQSNNDKFNAKIEEIAQEILK